MSSLLIPVLVLLLVCLVIASIVYNVWRFSAARKRSRTSQQIQLVSARTLPLTIRATRPLVPASTSARPFFIGYRRSLLSLAVLGIVGLVFFLQSGSVGGTLPVFGITIPGFHILPHSSMQPVAHMSNSGSTAHIGNSNVTGPVTMPLIGTASSRLVRVDSTSRSEYATEYQYDVWSYSSCSGMAMEMVMNAYGLHLIASDVLSVEQSLGVWSEQLGLLDHAGIAQTAAYYGFKAQSSEDWSLQQVVDFANQGEPVIVNIRDSYYYPGGHFFVIRGGDSSSLSIADSSTFDFQRMSRAQFLGMWQNFSVVLTPN